MSNARPLANGTLAFAIDVAARLAVVVALSLLMREFWLESRDPWSEFPLTWLLPPLALFLVWNVWLAWRSFPLASSTSAVDPASLVSLVVFSLLRAWWSSKLFAHLPPPQRRGSTVTVGLSLLCAAVAFVAWWQARQKMSEASPIRGSRSRTGG